MGIVLKEFIVSIDFLVAWGAILSTLLLIIKFVKMWQNHLRIEVDFLFTKDVNDGNYVTVRNLLATPIIITFWQLIWMYRPWYSWKWKLDQSIDGAPPFFDVIKIDGHSEHTLNFREGNYFDWDSRSLGNKKIYLRFNIAGRSKPILKKVV